MQFLSAHLYTCYVHIRALVFIHVCVQIVLDSARLSILQADTQLSTLTLKPGMSIAELFKEVRGIRSTLRAVGRDKKDIDFFVPILNALPRSYEIEVSQVKNHPALCPDITALQNLLESREEALRRNAEKAKQRRISADARVNFARAGEGGKGARGVGGGNRNGGERGACHNCGEHGHWANECPKPKRQQHAQHKH